LIRKLAEQGTTVFVTTHYMDEAEQCGRVALMKTGEIIALNSPHGLKEEIFKEPLYELNPLRELSRDESRDIKGFAGFKSIKPHGRRFHALLKDKNSLEQFKRQWRDLVDIHEIVPSLEDVFIAAVEGGA